MSITTFLTLWFLTGFITMLGLWVSDLRNRDYDENYFNINTVYLSLMTFLFGFISVAIVLITIFGMQIKDKKYFTRFIYKIANIGVKKNEKENR